jgi:hypothetical protein
MFGRPSCLKLIIVQFRHPVVTEEPDFSYIMTLVLLVEEIGENHRPVASH